MKLLSIILVFLSISILQGYAQLSPADKLFDKYSGKEGFTSVFISEYMFNLIMNIETEDPESKEIMDVVSNLTGIKIITAADPSKTAGVNFYEEIMNNFPKNEYKELMVIREEGQDVKFLLRERGGKIAELLLIVGGKDENVLISIQGNIDMKNISKIAKSLDIDGMEQLELIEEEK